MVLGVPGCVDLGLDRDIGGVGGIHQAQVVRHEGLRRRIGRTVAHRGEQLHLAFRLLHRRDGAEGFPGDYKFRDIDCFSDEVGVFVGEGGSEGAIG